MGFDRVVDDWDCIMLRCPFFESDILQLVGSIVKACI